MSNERPQEQRTIDWSEVIETALTAPGNMGNTYDRFYNYSYLNQIYLRIQGIQEPVATLKRWNAIGRTVLKGSKAKEIIRPLIVEQKQEDDTVESRLIGFKVVRCIFTLSDTEGAELPTSQLPEWYANNALQQLHIRQVTFNELNPNIQGYSRGKDVAINPVAVNPTKTLIHEIAHIVLGHTVPEAFKEYVTHRGLKEFEAEATAYLTMNELGQLDEQTATVSRGYIQNWLDSQRPPDHSIRRVFSATNVILKAGRIIVNEVVSNEGNGD